MNGTAALTLALVSFLQPEGNGTPSKVGINPLTVTKVEEAPCGHASPHKHCVWIFDNSRISTRVIGTYEEVIAKLTGAEPTQ